MTHLKLLTGRLNIPKDLECIRSLSTKIENKLSHSKSDNSQLDKISLEELQDINKILQLADFMLCKYEEKKETHSILENFVSIIHESAKSIQGVDDEISELIVSAEDSINKIKDMYVTISDKSDLQNQPQLEKCGSINLTNFSTEINTVEYQQNSQEETA